ncbi:hypothetical protein SMITH_528 [Smithella sp. ME-1]|nr:hypothetical protein SMITH_528 [Smithella sp. ME-1]
MDIIGFHSFISETNFSSITGEYLPLLSQLFSLWVSGHL